MPEVLLKLPPQWTIGGSHPQEYDFGEHEVVAPGVPANFENRLTSIKSAVVTTHGYGTIVHTIKADSYRGKCLTFKGALKVHDLSGWAGLWMRSSGGVPDTRFDNLQNRSVTADGWHHCECSFNVSEKASHIAFGALLHGRGQLWIGEIDFEITALVED